MKPYASLDKYGPQGPRLVFLGLKFTEGFFVYGCFWKWILYLGVKK